MGIFYPKWQELQKCKEIHLYYFQFSIAKLVSYDNNWHLNIWMSKIWIVQSLCYLIIATALKLLINTRKLEFVAIKLASKVVQLSRANISA